MKPDGLRNSYATSELEEGTEARVVQILLGHVNRNDGRLPASDRATRVSLKATLDKLMTDL